MAQLLIKIWEGVTENRDLPNEKLGFFSLSSEELITNAHEIIKQGFKTRLRPKEYHKCKQKHDVLFCAL